MQEAAARAVRPEATLAAMQLRGRFLVAVAAAMMVLGATVVITVVARAAIRAWGLKG